MAVRTGVTWISIFIGGILGIIMVAVVLAGEAAVSTTEFCTSCHSMSYQWKN